MTFKSINAKDKKSLSILITANSSQSAVRARAAGKKDVDSFIIKPYTLESLERALLNAAIQKISPSEYVMRIEEGKELMLQGKLVEAKEDVPYGY